MLYQGSTIAQVPDATTEFKVAYQRIFGNSFVYDTEKYLAANAASFELDSVSAWALAHVEDHWKRVT